MLNKGIGVRRVVVAATALVVLASAAGCSSGSDDTAGSAGTISFRTVAAEGSGFTNYPDAQAGAKAAVEAINKSGGINGKKIDFSFCNTRGETNQSTTCARQAVQDKVAAVVGSVDVYSSTSTPIYEAGKVPLVGILPTGGAIDNTSPASNPLVSGNYSLFASAVPLFKAAGIKKMVIIGTDFAATNAQADMVKSAADAQDMPIAPEIKVPSTGVSDYSPYAEQVKDEGADGVLLLLGPAGLQAVIKAIRALGVQAQVAVAINSFGEPEAQAIGADANDVWALSAYPAADDMSVPGIKEYNAQLDADGVSKTDLPKRRAAGVNAWLAMYAAAAVAKTIKGDVNAASMTAAMAKLGATDLQGLITWDPSAYGSSALGKFPRLPATKVYPLEFKDGKLQPVPGLSPADDPLQSIR